jgi:PAS domain S-box-containing protein
MATESDSQARLAAIVASSDDAIVSKDLNGTIMSWNSAAERLFGYSAEEAIGRPITMVIPDDRLSEEVEVLTRIRAGLSVEHFETIRQHKDGHFINISLTVSPILNSQGQVIGASKIARDITEQMRQRALVEEASRLKDEFLAVLSHELRTPLNTVLGYARMLRRDGDRMQGQVRERALEALERNADALTVLVNDVLDTSRIVTGKLRLELVRCALDEVTAQAVENIEAPASAKGIALEVTLEPGLIVMGDRDRLQQVIWNLLSNALKFTPGAGRIHVRAHRLAGAAAVSVADTGIGIAAEHLPYVFQRFWQAHTGASREFAGLGIGLALARHLVELHGGEISAVSGGVGHGATFTVALPTASSSNSVSTLPRITETTR